MPGWLSRRREDDQQRAREKREAEARAAEGSVPGEIEVQTAGETGIFGEIGQTDEAGAGSQSSEQGNVGEVAIRRANEARRKQKYSEVGPRM
jgi:hypothetical protein